MEQKPEAIIDGADFVVRSEVLCSFHPYDLPDLQIPIYQSVFNLQHPERIGEHRFFHAPAFLPLLNAASPDQLAVLSQGRGFIDTGLLLTSDDLCFQALGEIQKTIGTKSGDVEDHNRPELKLSIRSVTVLPCQGFEVKAVSDALGRTLPHGISMEPINQGNDLRSSGILLLRFYGSEENLQNFVREGYKGVRLRLDVRLHAAQPRRTTAEVRLKDLRHSQLYAALEGGGTRFSYVHRDDVRRLSAGVSRTLMINAVIDEEEGRRLEEDAIERLLGLISSDDAEVGAMRQWTEGMERTTFHGDDLKPSRMNASFNRLFTYDQNDRHYHVNKREYQDLLREQDSQTYDKGEGGGGFSFSLGIFSLGASGGGGSEHQRHDHHKTHLTEDSSFSSEELVNILKKHDVEASVAGDFILSCTPKVLQVNNRMWSSTKSLASSHVTVRDSSGYARTILHLNQHGIKWRSSNNISTTPSFGMLAMAISELQRNEETTKKVIEELQHQVANLKRVVNELQHRQPQPGTIWPFTGTTLPDGWLLCDGGSYNQIGIHASLYQVIGTTYGGDQHTFRVPDLRGRAMIGEGQGTNLSARARGQYLGAETHVLQVNEIPSHSHNGTTDGEPLGARVYYDKPSKTYVTATGPGNRWFNCRDMARDEGSDPSPFAHDHTFTTSAVGGSAAHNIMQPSCVVAFMIKY